MAGRRVRQGGRTLREEGGGTVKYPAAIGLPRAKDDNVGGYLWHTDDGGRLYVIRESPRYYLCATCDAKGRDAIVSNNRAIWTMTNKSPGPLGD